MSKINIFKNLKYIDACSLDCDSFICIPLIIDKKEFKDFAPDKGLLFYENQKINKRLLNGDICEEICKEIYDFIYRSLKRIKVENHSLYIYDLILNTFYCELKDNLKNDILNIQIIYLKN